MNPVSAITHGIEVTVLPHYHEEMSKPSLNKFVHSYQVRISNHSGLDVQLMSRHWIITDANRKVRHVKGDGVIGQQPTLEPEQSHHYKSWCPMSTPVGKMSGSFTMTRMVDNSIFEVEIPEFRLIANFKNN
ncbi:MAG: ApaG protein [Halioglobus sp.]|jgi:ApaG protein